VEKSLQLRLIVDYSLNVVVVEAMTLAVVLEVVAVANGI
jgi:hypothetical protein